jgi:hypothetical protein
MTRELENSWLKEQDDLHAALVKSVGAEVDVILSRMGNSQHEFAKQLIALGYPQLIDGREDPPDLDRQVYPCWEVSGMPSKKGRVLAEKWMLSRNVDWGGNTKLLRREVEDALVRGEAVPRFGFAIRLRAIARRGY